MKANVPVHVSCQNYQLSDGTTTRIDAGTECRNACKDRYMNTTSTSTAVGSSGSSGSSGTEYDIRYDGDHGQWMIYEWMEYEYVTVHRTGFPTEIYEQGELILNAECYCNVDTGSTTPNQDEKDYLCGPTTFGPSPSPKQPLPQCTDEGVGILSASDCANWCADNRYTVSEPSFDPSWSTMDVTVERLGCVCSLGASNINVKMCYPDPTARTFYDGTSSARGVGSSMNAGAVVGVVIAFVAFFCVLAVNRRGSDDDVPDPELLAFRADRRRWQQQQQQPSEESRRIRRDAVKDCLYTHQISADDGGVENLATIIAAQTCGDDNANVAADIDESARAAGNYTYFVDTLRSAVSTVRSIGGGGDGDGGSASECSICLMAYEFGDTVSWAKDEECDHVFHEQCILQWLDLHNNCPLCRKLLITEGDV